MKKVFDLWQMRILLLNPFHTASHQRWADALVKHSQHKIELITLPGRHWKWRMHGAAVQLATLLNQKSIASSSYDLLMVTDMLDLATLRGLCPALCSLHTILYFHENQLAYPWSPTDKDVKLRRDERYGWINYTSAMAANELWFNSAYHQRAWNESLPSFLRKFPNGKTLPFPKASQRVLPPPIEGLQELINSKRPQRSEPPIILWNHRWEYDKGPEEFFGILQRLKLEKVPFKLVMLGESYERSPAVFAKAKEDFKAQILHWGFVANTDAYKQWMLRADLLLVTSKHDFFGISVVEGLAAGLLPVLPQGLAYEEHFPEKEWKKYKYETLDEAYTKTLSLLKNIGHSNELNSTIIRNNISMYDSAHIVERYDEAWLQK